MSRVRQLDARRIAAFRLAAGGLASRSERGRASLRKAAHAGLPDSWPRAALLSIHARVERADPDVWDDPTLTQVWGPRFNVYVVADDDAAVFTLGR